MTTSNTLPMHKPNVRRRLTEYPAHSSRFDLAIALLSTIFAIGLHFDGWAHNNIPDLIETFFTPYHALLYGGFALVAMLLTATHLRNIAQGYAWTRALPRGYFLGLIGVFLFTIGGFGDFLWHETFGFEENTEALLSPTHLLLALGAFFYVSTPLRAAWMRTDSAEDSLTWRNLFPAILSVAILLSMLTFFTQYATLARPQNFIIAPTTANPYLKDAASIFSALAPSALITGTVLLLMRRWKLPFGTLSFLISTNYILMFTMVMQDSFDAPWTLPAIIASGVVADLLYMVLKPSDDNQLVLRIFAFLLPFTMVGFYIISLLLTHGLWWEVHMWAGVPFLSGVVGLLLSHLSNPAEIPTEAT